ncbi:hypothetical protein QYF61_018679 [Mycteria americana]|uniref:Interleukin-17 receptor C/E N-terminal domain-containing protein n=1 Tax=Mycteria americana TaxID=33587 RepID=A0AAN7PIH6_MYCAM|nr:hypothetical protein QYF61_018679 [Mycteria americana]
MISVVDCEYVYLFKGIHCKSKPSNFSVFVFAFAGGIFNSFCHDAPASLSSMVLKSMKISTVMKCAQGSPCSLHLNIKGTLSLDENIRGLEICALSLDTQQSQCTNVRFARKKSKMLNGKKVQVQFNCIEVNVAQHIYVTMKTLPNYCEVKLSQEYYVEDCRNTDVGKYISACSAGKFDYNVDRARKIISVNVSNFLRDQDYYVRLCHKWFTCEDVGAFAVIKGKESLKSVSLKYSQLLPCLCIEVIQSGIWVGWQFQMQGGYNFAPLKMANTKVLWDNIVYNPATQTLAWEPACPVLVMVNLCRLMNSNDHCEDIQNSSRNSPEKLMKLANAECSLFKQVKYSRVDTHPRLCMKFTTKQGSWVKCPFAHGEFPAWKMRTAAAAEQIQVFFTSQTKAQFSVLVCNRTQLASCESVGMHHSVSVVCIYYFLNIGDPVSITMSREMCGSTICIQVCVLILPDFRGQTYGDGNPAKAMTHRYPSNV